MKMKYMLIFSLICLKIFNVQAGKMLKEICHFDCFFEEFVMMKIVLLKRERE